MRASGIVLMRSAATSSTGRFCAAALASSSSRTRSVSMMPGATTLTRILRSASSCDSDLASPTTAARTAFDSTRPCTGCFTVSDVKCTMRGCGDLASDGSASLTMRTVDSSNRSTALRQAFSSSVSNEPRRRPARIGEQHVEPAEPRHRLAHGRRRRVAVRDIGDDRMHARPMLLLELLARALELVRIAPIDDDVGAFGEQPRGDRAPNPRRRPSDERALPANPRSMRASY